MALRIVNMIRKQRRALRKERGQDRTNPIDVCNDLEFIERVRFNRAGLLFLCDLMEQDLTHPTARNLAVPPVVQVYVAFLKYFATGTLQIVDGDCVNLHK